MSKARFTLLLVYALLLGLSLGAGIARAAPIPPEFASFFCAGSLTVVPPLPVPPGSFHVQCSEEDPAMIANLFPLSLDAPTQCLSVGATNEGCTSWKASWTQALEVPNTSSWTLNPLAGVTGCSLSGPSSGTGPATLAFTFSCPNAAQADSLYGLGVFAAVPTPEPPTLWLALVALIGLGAFARRRNSIAS